MWDCPNCETHHNRDENAAINIRAEGIRQLWVSGTGTSANGGDVSPASRTQIRAEAIPREVGSQRYTVRLASGSSLAIYPERQSI